MIDAITIRWSCDRCGYHKVVNYGGEDTNNPTIRLLPAGWSYYGNKRKRGDRKIECGECPYDYSKIDKKRRSRA